MLIPGLSKLFIMGPENVAGFLGSLGFPAATFFAMLLIATEVLTGIAILANYKLRYTTIPPIVILVIAGILTALPEQNWPTFIMHLTISANYWIMGLWKKD